MRFGSERVLSSFLFVVFFCTSHGVFSAPFGGVPPQKIKTDLGRPLLNMPPKESRIWVDSSFDHKDSLEIKDTLLKKLDEEGMRFIETPLIEAIEQIANAYSIKIFIDQIHLDDVAICPKTPISIDIKGVRLSTALKLLLGQHELDFYVKEGVLIVTLEEITEQVLKVAVYQISDLIPEGHSHARNLIELIRSTIERESWESRGVNAAISYNKVKGAIVVSQTEEAHDQILSLLNSLRQCETWRNLPRHDPKSPQFDPFADF